MIVQRLEFHLPGAHPQKTHGWRKGGRLTVKDYAGTVGDRSHITRDERGTVPTSAIASLPGVSGEMPGEHRNRKGPAWDAFLADIQENGIRDPIFVTVDYDAEPRISEGNHRRDAAVELGLPEVPIEIRYFGHAEQKGTVVERSERHQFGSASVEMLTKHPALTEIISRFKNAGIPLYVVGGPVRDLLSEGHPGLDLDMTSPADVSTIKALVNDLGALAPQGEEYGTVKLIRTLPDGEKWEVEITQHRGEVYDSDSRKPTTVATQDLAKDLSRRETSL